MSSLINKKISFRLAYNEWYEGIVINENKTNLTVKITKGWSPNPYLAIKVVAQVGLTVNICRFQIEKIL